MLILIHSLASAIALMVGTLNLLKTKGTKVHKIWGWIFVTSMLASSLSSFGIYNERFSLIHILSVLVIIWLSRAIYAIRFKHSNWLHVHASSIGAAYIAIVIAGVGVLVRKILLPGNSNAGYIASGLTAIVCIYYLNKMTAKYRGAHEYE